MTLSRGNGWSQSCAKSFLFSVVISVGSFQGLFAEMACSELLGEVVNASARPLFRFQPEGNLRSMPAMKGVPSHAASAMTGRFMYLIMPRAGNDYAVVEKSAQGFGFSNIAAIEFDLLESTNLELRDLQANGRNSFFLSAILNAKAPNAIVLKVTQVEDAESGRLSFADEPGLAIKLSGLGADVRLAPRPGTLDYWLTDQSGVIRLISFSREDGLHESFQMNVDEFLGSDPSGSKFVRVEAINFLSNGSTALVTARAANGKRWVVPITISETPVNAPAGTKPEAPTTKAEEPEFDVSYNSFPQNSFLLSEGERVIVREDKDLVILLGAKKIRGLSLSFEDLTWTELITEDLRFVEETEVLLDLGFYWDGQLVKPGEGEEAKVVFQGELKVYAIIHNTKRGQSRVVWLRGGNTTPASPASHPGIGPK